MSHTVVEQFWLISFDLISSVAVLQLLPLLLLLLGSWQPLSLLTITT